MESPQPPRPEQPPIPTPSPKTMGQLALSRRLSLADHDAQRREERESQTIPIAKSRDEEIAWQTSQALQKHPEANTLPLHELPIAFHDKVTELLGSGQRIWHVHDIIERIFGEPQIHPQSYAEVCYELDALSAKGWLLNLGNGRFCLPTRQRPKRSRRRNPERDLGEKLRDAGVRTTAVTASSVNRRDAGKGTKPTRH